MIDLSHQFDSDQVQRFMKFLRWRQNINQRKLKYLNFVSLLSVELDKLAYIGSQDQKLGYIEELATLRNSVMLKVVKFDAAIESVKNDPIIMAALDHYNKVIGSLKVKSNEQ